ncbi:MAG TPA: NAD(P)/FAD-dependent oxidoreductase [bacterium]|nr:NAD(P)/FAD-dependent oxidoreductase [bacterium]
MNDRKGTIGIIGAGVTGLAAGCYARMNGYDTTIFESHHIPGGLCTSWKKGDDYTIDGCIEWLVGVAPYGPLHQGWLELGALQGKRIVHPEVFMTYEAEGKALHLYSDVDRLEKHLLGFSPQDAKPIHRLTDAIRLFARLDKWNFHWDDLPLAPVYLEKAVWALRTNFRRFSLQFKDPFLRNFFGTVFGMPEMSILMLITPLGWHHNKNGGYPIGGSLEFAKSIEARYRGLGGKVQYEAKVEKILEMNGKVFGLELADGTEHYFDRILAAGDGHMTFERLLENRHNDEELYQRFKNLKPFNPIVVCSYGVRRDMSHEPHGLLLPLDPPLEVAGKPQKYLYVRHYAHDPTLAPRGRTIVKVSFQTDYGYWKALHADPARYEAEKHGLSRKVLALLDKRFLGITSQVEVTDVATPTTFERYTHNWRGSIEGWLPDLKSFLKPLPKTLKGLRGLYFAGQWVQPGGGLPTCLMTGKDIIKRICREDGKAFTTNLPPEGPAQGGPLPDPVGEKDPTYSEELFAHKD